MNRLLLLAATAILAAGCVNDSPLYVTGIFPMDEDCKLTPGTTRQFRGSLDLSGSPSYLLLIDLISELDGQLDTKADDQTLVTGKQRNTVVLDQISLTYVTVPSSIVLEPELVPTAIVALPGDTQHIGMNMFGPLAIEKLGLALPNAGDRAEVRVKVEFRGKINSGGRIASTPITYPITVYRSGTTCAAGEFFCPTGLCGNIGGQDGSPLVCSAAMACLAKP